MILLRLLSAGKSLVGMTRKEQGYHLPEGQTLPQFGAKKNPFRATTLPEQPKASPASKPIAAAETVREQRSEPARSKAPGQAARVPLKAAKGARATSWFKDLKGLCGRKGKDTFAATPIPLATQGELRLESIRVVRNDLVESDIEIVPQKGAGKPAVSASEGNGASSGSPRDESAWQKVSVSIFGPNNVG